MKAVALYFDGRNCYQSNFYTEEPELSFFSDMDVKGAVWAKLFNQSTGEIIATYNHNGIKELVR